MSNANMELKNGFECIYGSNVDDENLKNIIYKSIQEKLAELGYEHNTDYYAKFYLIEYPQTPSLVDREKECRNISGTTLGKVEMYVNAKILEYKESLGF